MKAESSKTATVEELRRADEDWAQADKDWASGARLTYGSLFAGIGGLDLGFERAGLECRWQVEKDEFCRRVLAKHFPGVKRYGAIEECGAGNLERVDILAGGFPCQDLSVAGKRAGIEGSRSGLWFEFARLIGEIRPKYIVIENVSGLLVYGAMRGGRDNKSSSKEPRSLP